MRTRSLSTFPLVSPPCRYDVLGPSGLVLESYPQACGSGGRDSTIIDEIPYHKAIGRVTHDVVEIDDMSGLTGLPWIQSVGVDAPYYPNLTVTNHYPSLVSEPRLLYRSYPVTADAPPALTPRGPISLVGLAARAVSKMNQLQLSNSLFESKDFPGMFNFNQKRQQFAKIFTGHQQADNRFWRLALGLSESVRPHRGKDRFQQFFRSSRDSSLEWTFGWSPTISDVKQIMTELPRAINQYNQKRKPVRVYVTDDTEVELIESMVPGVQGVRRSKLSSKRVGFLIAKPPPPERYYDSRFVSFEKFIMSVNANPLATIWEATPWSWAIDWVLSVDKLIDDLYLRLSGWSINVGRSEKNIHTYEWTASLPSSVNAKTGDLTFTPIKWEHRRVLYNRVPAELPGLLTNLKPRITPQKVFTSALVIWGLLDGHKGRR